MSRFYCYFLSAIVIFGSLGTAFLKQVGLLEFSFFTFSDPSPYLYGLAFLYCASFTVFLLIFRSAMGLKVSGSMTNEPISLPHGLDMIIIVVACTYALIYVWINADLLTANVYFRHFGNELFERISLLILLAGIFACSTKLSPTHILPMILLLFAATLYSAVNSGRSVALPFLVAAGTMLYNRHRIAGGVMGAIGAIALSAAFTTRDLPSFKNFWSAFLDLIVSVDVLGVVRPVIQYSFPGLDTMDVVAGRMQGPSFYRTLEFLAYYSPAPSGVFPAHFFDQTSLNVILGIDVDIVGLNPDIYSESLFWFGYLGVVLVPALLAFMCCASFASARTLFSGITRRSQLVAAIPVIWMLVGGMVFSLRAGSRFVWGIIIAALVVKTFRMLWERRDLQRAGAGR